MGNLLAQRSRFRGNFKSAALLQKRGLKPRHCWAGAKRIFTTLMFSLAFHHVLANGI
jgi:hypothetical protein